MIKDHRLLRAAYRAMVDVIDEQVGRMLDALERTGQRGKTLVIFMSDHGDLLGDHGMYLKGAYFYDLSIRVPLIISMPGTLPGWRRIPRLSNWWIWPDLARRGWTSALCGHAGTVVVEVTHERAQ